MSAKDIAKLEAGLAKIAKDEWSRHPNNPKVKAVADAALVSAWLQLAQMQSVNQPDDTEYDRGYRDALRAMLKSMPLGKDPK